MFYGRHHDLVDRYVPLVVSTFRSFITGFVNRLTRRVPGAGTAYPSGALEFTPGF